MLQPDSKRIGVGRSAVIIIVVILLVVGAVSVLFLPQILNPKKIAVVHVDIHYIPTGTNQPANRLFSPRNITVVIGVNNTVQWIAGTLEPNGTIGYKPLNGAPTEDAYTFTEGKPIRNYNISIFIAGNSLSYKYPPTTTPLFDSGPLKFGATYTYTFATPGVYEYYDAFHSGNFGFVIVKK